MKLIQTKDYLLLVDEKAEISKTETLIYENDTNFLNITGVDYKPQELDSKIIAYYPLTKEAKELDLPLLPNPFEKEIDIEKLAQEVYREYPTNPKDKSDWTYNRDIHVHKKRKAFIKGYKAAQSKQFSLEDVIAFGKKCFYKGFDKSENDDANSFTAWREECSKLIQSLSTQQLPKEFIPEELDGDDAIVSLALHGHYLKTITNSEGKEEIVGTYKY